MMDQLRRVVRGLLEAAVAGSQAATQGLALYRRSAGDFVGYVLYDPAAAEAAVPKWMDGDWGSAGDVTYAYLNVKKHGDCWGAGEVKSVAAQKGYGPLVYELAMSDFPDGLIPDRTGPSMAARNVWKKYAQRSDVQKKPLDDKRAPKTPPKEDDCAMIPDFDGEEAYLNVAYSGQGDGGAKPTLLQNHKQAIASIAAQAGKTEAEVEKAILDIGDEFFSARYNA